MKKGARKLQPEPVKLPKVVDIPGPMTPPVLHMSVNIVPDKEPEENWPAHNLEKPKTYDAIGNELVDVGPGYAIHLPHFTATPFQLKIVKEMADSEEHMPKTLLEIFQGLQWEEFEHPCTPDDLRQIMSWHHNNPGFQFHFEGVPAEITEIDRSKTTIKVRRPRDYTPREIREESLPEDSTNIVGELLGDVENE